MCFERSDDEIDVFFLVDEGRGVGVVGPGREFSLFGLDVGDAIELDEVGLVFLLDEEAAEQLVG